jgi:mono/diheme cytochrome c family protein
MLRSANFLKSLILAFSLLFFWGGNSLLAQDAAAGQKVFRTYCAACHKIDKDMTGPKLGGVNEKYAGDMEWLYSWIKNAPALINSGDAKAVALYEQWGTMMQANPTLTDGDIDNVLAYVSQEWEAAQAATVETAATGGGAQGNPLDQPEFYYALLALVAVLLLITVLLLVITATLVSAVRAKENQEPLRMSDIQKRTMSLLKSRFVITAITLIVLVGGLTKYVEWARGISIHQGYMPEQPIKYSHALHAGEYGIECEYCHSGATKSKNAWIPSANVCMNCHKLINEGPKYGTEEIQKIYDAIGFDPATKQYIEGYEQKPIEWVRIHNLPDHAYFNHAQHVVVGGLECQTCHGPIEEMEVVYQYSTLGMGWCINCHREEKVKTLGKENPEGLTVEDMGGLDCARCHY